MSNAIASAGRNRAEAITEPAPTASTAPPPLTGFAAGATGAALLAAGVWGLHVLSPPGGGAVSVGSVVLLLVAFTALGKGITLLQRALAPMAAAATAAVSGVPALVRTLASVVVGASGVWWVLRGYAAAWWAHTTGATENWALSSALVQVALIAVAGALLFGGAKSLVTLLIPASRARHRGDRWAAWWSSRPGLGLLLLAGAAAVVTLSGYIVPRALRWLLGGDQLAALTAIVVILTVGLLANTWWWGALSGWWAWAHRPHTPGGGATPLSQMHAGAAVVALLWFSATAFGLAAPDSYTGPGAMPRAHADCPPDCGGSSGGSGSSGPAFPMQPPDMPNPPGGYNNGYYPAPDQGNGISIYNPGAGQGVTSGQGGYPQYPSQGQPGPPANGVQPPDYDAPLPSPAPGPQQVTAPQQVAPAPQQPAAQEPAQAPQAVQQAPAQQGPQPGEQSQGQLQPRPQQPQNPVNQPATQQVPQQPQDQQPTSPTKEPDKTPVDPTDLAAAATRRGSQQGGQQAVQQGAQQATQQATKEQESARVVKQSGDLFKQDVQDGEHDPYTGADNHKPQVKTPLPPQYDPNTGAANGPGGNPLDKLLEGEIESPVAQAQRLDITTTRARALGMDPATGGFRASEAETALRVERELGVNLTRAGTHDGFDWIDASGKTYDAVGNFPSKFFDSQWPTLQGRIVDHLAKADIVPVDVSQFTAAQRELVLKFIQSLNNSRVIVIGGG